MVIAAQAFRFVVGFFVVQLKAYHVSRVVVFVHLLGETEKPKQSPGFIASNGDSRHPTAEFRVKRVSLFYLLESLLFYLTDTLTGDAHKTRRFLQRVRDAILLTEV